MDAASRSAPDGAKIEISSVAISGDAVQITCASDLPSSGVVVGYALTSGGVQLSVASKAVPVGAAPRLRPVRGIDDEHAEPELLRDVQLDVHVARARLAG